MAVVDGLIVRDTKIHVALPTVPTERMQSGGMEVIIADYMDVQEVLTGT